MSDLPRLISFVLAAHDDSNRMNEAAEIDSAQIEREERSAGDEPDHDQGHRNVADVDGEEDQI